MADKYEKLAGEFNHFQQLMERDGSEELRSEETNPESHHPELIDFDRLKETLGEAAELCLSHNEGQRELLAVKAWLTGRIKAFHRAYRVTAQLGDAPDERDFETLSVTKLINQFENEGRRLRRSTSIGDSHLLESKQIKQPDYRQFKS